MLCRTLSWAKEATEGGTDVQKQRDKRSAGRHRIWHGILSDNADTKSSRRIRERVLRMGRIYAEY